MRTPEDYAREGKKAVEEGYDCLKYDFFTYRPDEGNYTDLDRISLLSPSYLKTIESRVAAVREAVGPVVDLIIENHSHPSADQIRPSGNRTSDCHRRTHLHPLEVCGLL